MDFLGFETSCLPAYRVDCSAMSYSYTYLEDAQYRAIVFCLCEVRDGVYVDVGPQHPGTQSLTNPLYERRWQGVNVEPVAQYWSYLNTVRPRDVNVHGTVGSANGLVDFQDLGPAGWKIGHEILPKKEGPTTPDQLQQFTLAEVCRQHEIETLQLLRVATLQPADLVLNSLNWQALRPWVVVVESFSDLALDDALAGRLADDMTNRRYALVSQTPTRRVFLAQEQGHQLAALQDTSTVHETLPPIPVLQPARQGSLQAKADEASKLAAEREAARQAALARPLLLKLKLAFQERRVGPAIKARTKKEVLDLFRAILKHESGRRILYFLTKASPMNHTRMRNLSPHPKMLHSAQVQALMRSFEANVAVDLAPLDLKV
jgi:hypothetical protein